MNPFQQRQEPELTVGPVTDLSSGLREYVTFLRISADKVADFGKWTIYNFGMHTICSVGLYYTKFLFDEFNKSIDLQLSGGIIEELD